MQPRRFDIGDAVTFFFKRFGEKPAGATWIILWQIFANLAIAALFFYFMGPIMLGVISLAELEQTGRLDSEVSLADVWALVRPFFTTLPLLTLLGLIATVAIHAAWLRFLARGEIAPIIPFRFAGDEFRLLGVAILFMALLAIGGMGFSFVFAMIAGVSMTTVMIADLAPSAMLGAGAVMLVAGLAYAAIAAFVLVRLSPAFALSFYDRRFRFFEAWGASAGRFWPMLFSYVLVKFMIMVIAAALVGFILLASLGALMPLGMELEALSQGAREPTAREVFDVFMAGVGQPGVIIPFAIVILLSGAMESVFMGMVHGVGAYAAITHRDSNPDEETDARALGSDHAAGASPSEG
jgi:hypothetical protein